MKMKSVPEMMKEITCTVKFPKTTVWRAKIFIKILRFAVWIGGFGGVDFVEQDNGNLTPRQPDPATPRGERLSNDDGSDACGF